MDPAPNRSSSSTICTAHLYRAQTIMDRAKTIMTAVAQPMTRGRTTHAAPAVHPRSPTRSASATTGCRDCGGISIRCYNRQKARNSIHGECPRYSSRPAPSRRRGEFGAVRQSSARAIVVGTPAPTPAAGPAGCALVCEAALFRTPTDAVAGCSNAVVRVAGAASDSACAAGCCVDWFFARKNQHLRFVARSV